MSKNGTLNRSDIKEQIKLINNTKNYYASENGNLYKLTKNNKYLKLKLTPNPINNYIYCGIKFNDKDHNISVRVHRIIAQCFIPNPNNLPIVGHKDNNKQNNQVNNLYWTTTSQNTQKAFDDHLIENKKGIQDSQSKPIACFNNNHKLISVYGSIGEADRSITGFSKSSISKVLDKTKHGRKGYYFQTISKQFYQSHLQIANKQFKVPYYQKHRIKFQVYKNDKILFNSNNQKETAQRLNISQGLISQRLRSNSHNPINGYVFKRL